MNVLKNLKDPITDLIGLAIMIVTLYMIYEGKATWLWEGFAGLGAGAVLLMMPDDFVVNLINRIADKFLK